MIGIRRHIDFTEIADRSRKIGGCGRVGNRHVDGIDRAAIVGLRRRRRRGFIVRSILSLMGDPAGRVDQRTVDLHLEMEVVAGRVAGGAHVPDDLALGDVLPGADDGGAVHVGVQRGVGVALDREHRPVLLEGLQGR